MSERQRSSPAWKNPRERMNKHLKRKSSRSLHSLIMSQPLDDLNTESCPPMADTSANSLSSSNPFKKSPEAKRSKPEDDEELRELPLDWDDSCANDQFAATTIAHSRVLKLKKAAMPRTKSMPLQEVDFSNMFAQTSPSVSSSPVVVPEEVTWKTMPVDLRLGSKVRIVSSKPFPWMKKVSTTVNIPVHLTANDQVEGFEIFTNQSDASEKIPESLNPSSLLEAASYYYQFPSFPWISLYPRIDTLLKTLPKITAPPMAPSMIEDLKKQWTKSFNQLYLSWKKGRRSRFYVACATFTVMFTKVYDFEPTDVNEDSSSCFQTTDGMKLVAIVTPTTPAFRSFLKKEGVDFELCSWKKKRLSKLFPKFDDSGAESCEGLCDVSKDSSRRVSFEMNNENEVTTTKEPAKTNNSDSDESPTKRQNALDHDWLHDMGVSPRNTLKLRRHKSMTTTTTTKTSNKEDKEETTAIVVTGPSVQTLFNVMQTEKICRAIAGPHANLPPTLLASKPFLHAQLQSLRKCSQVVKKVGKSVEFIAELDGGPVMHHNVQMIVNFIRRAGLCDDGNVTLRVNDRPSYAGLNGTENVTEWSEIKVLNDSFVSIL